MITIAKQNGFLVNNTEKVLRLSAILNHLIKTRHGQCLALKGGTAINLFLLDLPRLSVDIDFDFAFDCSNEKLPAIREEIKKDLCSFMENEGYSLTAKSKFAKALDSFVFSYFTLSGSRDLLKVEINYADRLHVLPTLFDEKRIALGEVVSTRRLSNDELIASKINALIVRTTPRDIYDVYNLFNAGLADSSLIKKIALFYVALGSEAPVDFEKLSTIASPKSTLLPITSLGAL